MNTHKIQHYILHKLLRVSIARVKLFIPPTFRWKLHEMEDYKLVAASSIDESASLLRHIRRIFFFEVFHVRRCQIGRVCLFTQRRYLTLYNSTKRKLKTYLHSYIIIDTNTIDHLPSSCFNFSISSRFKNVNILSVQNNRPIIIGGI